jgi:hypothetical protein
LAYTYFPPNAQLTIQTLPQNALQLSTSNASINMFPLPAVDWKGVLIYAAVDIIFCGCRDTSGGDNWVGAATVQIQDSGSTWRTAGSSGVCGYILADEAQIGMVEMPGSADIKQYVMQNTAQYVRLHNIYSNADFLYIYNCFGRLRLYFEV